MGYYTALIRHLAGASGHSYGDKSWNPNLHPARQPISHGVSSNVRVIHGDASSLALDSADVIYVNAGATRPAKAWLDALAPGGRMILPLTVGYVTDDGHPMTRGLIFLIERRPEYIIRRGVR